MASRGRLIAYRSVLVRAASAGLVLLVLLALLVAPAVGLAAPAAFEDVNNNSVFDAGDVDITAVLASTGSYSTANSIVVAGKLKSKAEWGVSLLAGQNIVVQGDLVSTTRDAALSLMAQAGRVEIGDKAEVRAEGDVDLNAAGDITVGKGAVLRARGNYTYLGFYAGGSVAIGEKVKLAAGSGIDITAQEGTVTVGPDAKIDVDDGRLSINAEGDIVLNELRVTTGSLSIYTSSHNLSLRDARVRFPKVGGYAYLVAGGSTIDVRGTKWDRLSPDDLYLNAENVLQ